MVEPEQLLEKATEIARSIAAFPKENVTAIRNLYAESAELGELGALTNEQHRSKQWMADRFSRSALAEHKAQIIAEGSAS